MTRLLVSLALVLALAAPAWADLVPETVPFNSPPLEGTAHPERPAATVEVPAPAAASSAPLDTGRRTFSRPTFSAPTFSNPTVSMPRAPTVSYSNPTFTLPTYSNPRFSNPTFSNPTFSRPAFSNPTFSKPGF